MTSVFKNTSDLIVEDGFDSYAASSVSYYLNWSFYLSKNA